MLHWCICEILGAQRTKAKTKKKQWWRPWVDHASSRLTPQISFFSSSTLIGPCVLDQNAEDSHTAPGLWRHQHTVVLLQSDFSLFCLYLRALVTTCSSRVHYVWRGASVSRWSIKPRRYRCRAGLPQIDTMRRLQEKMTNVWRFVLDIV